MGSSWRMLWGEWWKVHVIWLSTFSYDPEKKKELRIKNKNHSISKYQRKLKSFSCSMLLLPLRTVRKFYTFESGMKYNYFYWKRRESDFAVHNIPDSIQCISSEMRNLMCVLQRSIRPDHYNFQEHKDKSCYHKSSYSFAKKNIFNPIKSLVKDELKKSLEDK